MANKIHLRIITPTRCMFEDDVEMVIMRAVDGEIGFMAGHVPLTTVLDYGVMKITTDGSETKEAVVLGGFVEISDNTITVLSDVAEWPDEIDIKRAEEAKQRAERRLNEKASEVDTRRAELALRRATVRLDVSSYTIIQGRVTN